MTPVTRPGASAASYRRRRLPAERDRHQPAAIAGIIAASSHRIYSAHLGGLTRTPAVRPACAAHGERSRSIAPLKDLRAGARDRLLILTVSEFGRRVHGNAARSRPRRRGRFHRRRLREPGPLRQVPSLRLDQGDLKAETDFRSFTHVLEMDRHEVAPILAAVDNLAFLNPPRHPFMKSHSV